jgi:eukaryotic-like serine/threonine-protein kinase
MELFAASSPVHECPNRNILIDFDLGKLPAAELAAVAHHVSSCERCEEVVHSLQEHGDDDSLIARLKECMNGPPPPDGPAYAGMEALAETVLMTTGYLERTVRDGALGFSFEETITDKSFGQYEVLGKIDEGGMGVVYLARQIPLQRMVALKMILAGHHADAQFVARFIREGKAVAKLRHPNVVQVYELGEHDGLPYYSMELVNGGSLRARLAGGPLEPREAAEIVRTLAAAMEYAHQEGVIHRDLKPANILLEKDGTPKIADFGLAKLLNHESCEITTVHLTESGAILGTPCYMSPEQAAGSSEIGRLTDVYSLGTILYQSLTGRPPFSGTKVEILRLVRSTAPPTPSSVRPGIPYWLESVCLKCLEKSPARRYPSAQALADDLGRWLREERPQGVPSRLTRLRRRARRHQAVFLTGLALILVAAPLLSVGATHYLNMPERTIERIEDELARGRAVKLIGETGSPKWSRWMCGKSGSSSALANDGTFTVDTWSLGLLELLRDPQSESYKITAQVRHEKSDIEGEVGLFFARSASRRPPSNLQFFTQLTFNAVRGNADRVGRFPPEFRPPGPVKGNVVLLLPHLLSDEALGPYIDRRLSAGATGPRFMPLGSKNGRWHDLEVIVTPVSVTARWDNEPSFSAAPSEIQKNVNLDLTAHPLPAAGALPRGFLPEFSARGGLGLYIWKGVASFRSFTVTPLSINPPRPSPLTKGYHHEETESR